MSLFIIEKDLKQLIDKLIYTGTYFGTCTDQFELVTPMYGCKEYTVDAYYTTITGKPSILIPRIVTSPENLRILASNTNKRYKNVLSLLHKMEDLFCIQKTVIQTDKQENVYVFSHAPEWRCCVPMLSLYTLLIRLGFQSYNFESDVMKFLENDQTEKYILQEGLVGINLLINGGLKFFKDKKDNWENWKKYSVVSLFYDKRVHDSGIRTFGIYLKENKITCLEQLI